MNKNLKNLSLIQIKINFYKNLILFLIILKFVTPLISTLKLWLDTLEQDSSWQLLYSHLLLRKYLYKRDVCLVCNNPSSDGLAGIKILVVSISHGRPIIYFFSFVWLGRKLRPTRPMWGYQKNWRVCHNPMIF